MMGASWEHMTSPMLFLFLEKKLYAFDWKDNFCSEKKITWRASWGCQMLPTPHAGGHHGGM